MQDKYAGDIRDFGKFILLKQLLIAGPPQMRLGINWYNVKNEISAANDGRHVGYLDSKTRKRAEFERCDPDLYHKLKVLVEQGKRSISELERSQLLPQATKYFSEALPSDNPILSLRVKDRTNWFERSQQALSSTDAIFLDPDNGIETPTATKAQTNAVKYAFLDEIQNYFATYPIVIVYNHRDRTPELVYRQKLIDAHKALGSQSLMRILRFKRFSVRDYVFFYRKEHQATIERLFNVLTNPPSDLLFQEFVL
jgi:hypothetical protein